jgi:hypothetical protein
MWFGTLDGWGIMWGWSQDSPWGDIDEGGLTAEEWDPDRGIPCPPLFPPLDSDIIDEGDTRGLLLLFPPLFPWWDGGESTPSGVSGGVWGVDVEVGVWSSNLRGVDAPPGPEDPDWPPWLLLFPPEPEAQAFAIFLYFDRRFWNQILTWKTIRRNGSAQTHEKQWWERGRDRETGREKGNHSRMTDCEQHKTMETVSHCLLVLRGWREGPTTRHVIKEAQVKKNRLPDTLSIREWEETRQPNEEKSCSEKT